ncbi:hypothetical protein MP638_000780, partial [Amoeboaphelidium occidentale]
VVRKWNISSGSEVAVFSGHNTEVDAIFVTNEVFLSGFRDAFLKIWNKVSGFQLRSIDTINMINVILAFDVHVAIGTYNGVKLVDLISGQEIIYITEPVSCDSLALTGIYLFTGHGNGEIKCRDPITLSVLGIFSGHKSTITSLQFDESN